MRAKRSKPARIFKSGHQDANHAAIVEALCQYGPEPIDTTRVGGGFPDLCWPFQGQTVLIEVKTPKGALTPAQVRFIADWRGGPIFIISSAAQIPAMIAEIQKPTIRNRVIG